MKHNSSIRVLTAHLKKLNDALAQEEKAIDEPELMSDYHLAMSQAANIKSEIQRHQRIN